MTFVPDVARCVTADGERYDGESETFIARPLRAQSQSSHRADSETYVAAFDWYASDSQSMPTDAVCPPLKTTMHPAVAFAQNSRDEVRLEGGDGQVVGALKAGGGKPGQSYPAIAYGFRSDAGREGSAKTPSADAAGRVRLRDPGFNVTEDVAPTLDASHPHGVGFEGGVRRLTPLECERLMNWPDRHTLHGVTDDGKHVEMADGPRYRMAGNGVVASVATWIGKRIASLEGAA